MACAASGRLPHVGEDGLQGFQTSGKPQALEGRPLDRKTARHPRMLCAKPPRQDVFVRGAGRLEDKLRWRPRLAEARRGLGQIPWAQDQVQVRKLAWHGIEDVKPKARVQVSRCDTCAGVRFEREAGRPAPTSIPDRIHAGATMWRYKTRRGIHPLRSLQIPRGTGRGMAQGVQTVTDNDFPKFVGQNGVVLVDFWAPWCGPCRRVGPVIEQLSGEMPSVHFGKLNTDENQMTAAQNGIMSIPTIMIYKNGQKVDQIVGAYPKEHFVAAIKKHL